MCPEHAAGGDLARSQRRHKKSGAARPCGHQPLRSAAEGGHVPPQLGPLGPSRSLCPLTLPLTWGPCLGRLPRPLPPGRFQTWPAADLLWPRGCSSATPTFPGPHGSPELLGGRPGQVGSAAQCTLCPCAAGVGLAPPQSALGYGPGQTRGQPHPSAHGHGRERHEWDTVTSHRHRHRG